MNFGSIISYWSFDVYYKKTEGLSIKATIIRQYWWDDTCTGSLYNRGFDFEMHYDLIKTKTLSNIKFCW
jgi:hypothetical protein